MMIFDKFKQKQKRIYRIKNNIRRATAKHYIEKHAEDVKTLNSIHRTELKAALKEQAESYNERIAALQKVIDQANKDVKWYRKEFGRYCDLKDELEKVSGSIDLNAMQQKIHEIFAVLAMAKDKVELVGYRHNIRKISGVR